MSGPEDPTDQGNWPDDAELVAYLDGELAPEVAEQVRRALEADPALAERLALLAAGGRPFRTAFDPLLDAAPHAALHDMLRGLTETPAATPPVREPRVRRGRRLAGLAAAALVLLAVGAGLDRAAGPWPASHPARVAEVDDHAGWRQAVAEYLALYTPQTLASAPENAAMRAEELAAVGARLGLPLSPEAVALSGLDFRRAQIFDYDGKALGQVAYLDPAAGPVALCIIAAHGSADTAASVESRLGMNIVHWTRGGSGFMVIGHLSADRLLAIAKTLQSRLPA